MGHIEGGKGGANDAAWRIVPVATGIYRLSVKLNALALDLANEPSDALLNRKELDQLRKARDQLTEYTNSLNTTLARAQERRLPSNGRQAAQRESSRLSRPV